MYRQDNLEKWPFTDVTHIFNSESVDWGLYSCVVPLRRIFQETRHPVVSKESLWVCLCISLSLLGNSSVHTFPRQRRIFGSVFFYAGHVLSKESRRLVLHRTEQVIHQTCIREYWFHISAGTPALLTEVFKGFLSPFRHMPGCYPDYATIESFEFIIRLSSYAL
jgi:hypothetical protein